MERLIKRYQNRKLYDTQEKQYIKLSDIQDMIRENVDVKIIDNVSGKDLTHQILVQLVMRSEQTINEKRVPLDGLKDLIQNENGPIFQAFRGVMSFSRDIVQQIGNTVSTTTSTSADSAEEGNSKPESGQIRVFTELLKKSAEKLTDSAVKIVNGSLAREMLKLPTREDLSRLERKFEKLEEKLSEHNKEEGDV